MSPEEEAQAIADSLSITTHEGRGEYKFITVHRDAIIHAIAAALKAREAATKAVCIAKVRQHFKVYTGSYVQELITALESAAAQQKGSD